MHLPETTIETLIEAYTTLLFDAYGVLVHAGGAMPGAAALVEQLNRSGKPYYLVTNDASKLPATASARFSRFGLAIPPERIVTSGELLAPYVERQRLAGAACAVLGTADSARYAASAALEIVAPDRPFDVLVVADETGYPFLEAVDAALTSLFARVDAGHAIHVVVPNPDLIYPRGESSFGIAAGSIALMLEAACARRYGDAAPVHFARLGKPHPHLYREAMRRAPAGPAVMVGDQVETDVRGAIAAGIDSALVTTGVSADLHRIAPADRPTYLLRTVAPAGSREARLAVQTVAVGGIEK